MLTCSFKIISIPGSPPAGPPCPWAPWRCPARRPEWPQCLRASGPACRLQSGTSAGPVPASVPPADHLTSPNELSRMSHRSHEGKIIRIQHKNNDLISGCTPESTVKLQKQDKNKTKHTQKKLSLATYQSNKSEFLELSLKIHVFKNLSL